MPRVRPPPQGWQTSRLRQNKASHKPIPRVKGASPNLLIYCRNYVGSWTQLPYTGAQAPRIGVHSDRTATASGSATLTADTGLRILA